ncbi:hypothetical protein A2933_00630 [Candidatus Nomurabacteria bacterium RIFCSPLOWO2_01_FULL_46_18]|uniref:Transcriptional regulator n=1 Tax=Candidatus Nomurabacteria bacterium RIFCSPLOWO2_01_FULL_46_18 TaxID=1801783 RepID=A0A1F6XEU2_9BACT|nr:MAG: hypothetical protein A2933_00630 [Candidatus Nomurabacteria bacterium RIFCSPLOWO2_01_FULL_46_18]
MAGHNKWSQIRRQKEVTDAKKSKAFSKLTRMIGVQARISAGKDTVELRAAVEKAKKANVPKDIIERAVKKAGESAKMETATYETYGPGGVGVIIEALTDNKNRTTQEIKHILSENNSALGSIGSVAWVFSISPEKKWIPKNTTSLSGEDLKLLEKLVDELEENDDVQEVYTNAE